jgi:CO/xanthine dehydrogenase Mo-binding subunit
MENYKQKNGRTSTSGFVKYFLPSALDVPRVNSISIEDPDPIAPRGKGRWRASDGANHPANNECNI